MKNRKSIVIIVLTLVLISVLLVGRWLRVFDLDVLRNHRNAFESELPDSSVESSALFIPELIDMTHNNSEFEITVDETEFEFFPGYKAQVKSYNEQGYLGKTMRLKRGNTFYPSVTNNLDEITTIHWHGLEVAGESDGAMGSVAIVNPGETKTYELSVDQQASTIWYHPHAKGFTASQAYEGLAGLIIIEDEYSNDLNLPSDYGVNDLPIVLQAKLFEAEGNLNYGNENTEQSFENGDNSLFNGLLNFEDETGENSETTDGFVIMTNGAYRPYVTVANEVIRLRTLNGSNHGIMDISASDDTKLHIIATDGGFLEAPSEQEQFEIAAGQRFEVLLDLTDKEIGETVDVIANNQVVLTVVVSEESNWSTALPNGLVAISPFEEYNEQKTTHTYALGRNTINGKQMDMMRIDETFVKDEIYYFEVTNEDDENHSFHIHNSQFLVVELNGELIDYKSSGWKDTIYLRPGESMKLQVKFRFTGDYMYHCHILIHEEKGMMGTFRVVDEE